MKAGHKYLGSTLLYLCALLLAFVIFPLVQWLTTQLLGWLSLLFGGAIPVYNEITEPELFASQQAVLSVVEVFITLLILEAAVSRLDNKRFEFMITKTEGLYTIPEGVGLYMREFLILDIVTVSVLSAVTVAVCPFIPAVAFDYGADLPLRLGYELYLHHGAVLGSVLIAVCAVAARLISSLLAVRRYRALWLSGGEDV